MFKRKEIKELRKIAEECAGTACLCHNNCQVDTIEPTEYGSEQIYDILYDYMQEKSVLPEGNILSTIVTPALFNHLEELRDNIETAMCINDAKYYSTRISKLQTALETMSCICEEVITYDIINKWDEYDDLHLSLKIYLDKKPNYYIIIGEGE